MIKVHRYQLGVWKTRIELVLNKCDIPVHYAVALECMVNEIDYAVRAEQKAWDSHKEEIQRGEVVRL